VKTFTPFTEFPTVDRLAQAQAEYAVAKLPVKRRDDGVPEPFPPPTKKADVFRPEDFKTIDAYARQVTIISFYGDLVITSVVLIRPVVENEHLRIVLLIAQ